MSTSLEPLDLDTRVELLVREPGADEHAADLRRAKKAAYERRVHRYAAFCRRASEARYALDRCARLAGVKWETAQKWMGDRLFVDMWAREMDKFREEMFGTGVELALGKTITKTNEEGIEEIIAVIPPDGAHLRFYQTALDPRFAKRATVDHTGVIDVQVHSALSQMSDEEKRAEILRLLGETPLTIETEASE